jgi:hypothetical protein
LHQINSISFNFDESIITLAEASNEDKDAFVFRIPVKEKITDKGVKLLDAKSYNLFMKYMFKVYSKWMSVKIENRQRHFSGSVNFELGKAKSKQSEINKEFQKWLKFSKQFTEFNKAKFDDKVKYLNLAGLDNLDDGVMMLKLRTDVDNPNTNNLKELSNDENQQIISSEPDKSENNNSDNGNNIFQNTNKSGKDYSEESHIDYSKPHETNVYSENKNFSKSKKSGDSKSGKSKNIYPKKKNFEDSGSTKSTVYLENEDSSTPKSTIYSEVERPTHAYKSNKLNPNGSIFGKSKAKAGGTNVINPFNLNNAKTSIFTNKFLENEGFERIK